MVEVTKSNVDLWLTQGGALGEELISSLESFTEEHPYYGPTQAILAKAYFNTKNQNFEKQLKKAALCTNDRLWLYNFIHQTIAEKEVVKVVEPNVVAQVEPDSAVKVEEPAKPNVKTVAKKKVSVKKTVAKKKAVAKKIDTVKELKKKAAPKKEVLKKKAAATKTGIKKKVTQKKTVVEKAVKINIALGEGEVITNLIGDQKELEAKTPKLQVENLTENKEEANKVETTKSGSHSFLDWLDYTGLNQEGKLQESKEERSAPELRTKENNVSKTVELLEKFIANKPKPGEIKLDAYKPEEKSIQSDSDELIPVSETLAEVLISQNELEKAEEVYQKLMLKFPQKSTYFAALIQKLNNK